MFNLATNVGNSFASQKSTCIYIYHYSDFCVICNKLKCNVFNKKYAIS